MRRAVVLVKSLLLAGIFLLAGLAAPEQALAQCATTGGGPNVFYQGCTQATTGNATSITLNNPAGTAVGDVLIATIATDGNTSPIPDAPSGWTLVSSGNSAGEVSLAVWRRTRVSGGPTSHTFSWTGNEAAVATLMRFSGTLESTLVSAASSGASVNATTPSVTTTVNNSLIVRLAAVDRQSVSVPGGLTVVTAATGGAGGNSMGYAAGLVNQAVAGASGTLNFTSNNDEWRTVTIALRPFFPASSFRIAHDGSADTCSLETITISARDVNGDVVPNYTGTVTLTAPNGDWLVGNGTGAFSNGTAGDGIATYTFTASDNGTVNLQYTPTAPGILDIDVTDGSISAPDDGAANDPPLSAARCGFAISHDGNAGTCGYELITISATKPDGVTLRDAAFTGSVDILTSTTAGTWTLESGSGSISDLGNGNITFTFAAGNNNVAVLRLTHTSAASVNFDLQQSAVDVQLGSDTNLNVGACNFAFTHAGTGDNCSIQSVTLTVRDPGNSTVLGYTGTVSLSTDTGLGIWYQGGATNVPDNSPTTGDGSATYAFAAADNGVAVLGFTHDDPGPVTFDAADNTFSITTASAPALTITACSFRISFSGTADKCTPKSITFTVVDGAGNTITNYSGTVDISAAPANGTWALNGGTANDASFSDNGNGTASYTFVAGDGGDITLAYSNSVNNSVNFHITDGLLVPHSSYDPSLTISNCEFRISHSGSTDICSLEPVTITLYDSTGAVATNFSGTVSLSTSTGNGSWDDYDGANAGASLVNDLGNGSATYQFLAGDQGSVTFYFSSNTIETLNINVAYGLTTEIAGGTYDPDLIVGACTPRVNAVQCVNGASTSLSIPGGTSTNNTRAVVLLTGYEGTTAASSATFDGQAMSSLVSIQNTGNPANSQTFTQMFYMLDSSLPSAAGSYTGSFTPNSGQTLCLIALQNVRQDVPVSASSEGSGGASITTAINVALDDSVVLSAVTENSNTDFGTSSLGTRIFEVSGGGTDWIFTGSTGLANGGSQNVTETSQGGAGLGRWTHALASFGPAPAPLSYFTISHDLQSTACTQQAVTITAYDVNGNVKSDYTGTVTLSTSTAHGTWTQGTATNAPVDGTADDGAGTYTFAAADNGVVTLNLLVPYNENLNIDVQDGLVDEDAGFDQDLNVAVCSPVHFATQCYTGTSGAVSIPASSVSSARAVVLSAAFEASPVNDPSLANVLFDGQSMTSIRSQKATTGDNTLTNTTEMWVILDSSLPSAAGSYSVSFGSSTGSFPNTPGFCLTTLYGIEQTVPTGSAVNSTSGTTQDMSTTITTASNNAFVLSIVSDDRNTGNYTTTSLSTRLWNNVSPPANARFGGSYGYKPSAGPVTVTDLASSAPLIHTHIVAAFSPVVAGSPTAANYEPVTLFQSFSGTVNYRAYGNTLRAEPNGGDACAMIDPNVGSSVAVDIPPSSTVVGAYLYWAASGSDALGHTDADVFLNGLPITADQIFFIEDVGNAGNRDYFAGYKDVTTVVTSSGTYTLTGMTPQGGAPWNGSDSCAAGWALVVVYENAGEDLHVINLFHGFQPFQNSSFTLVPRNFRIAANDAGSGGDKPYGQISHITIEGDETISNGDESLGLQSSPGALTFLDLLNAYNPVSAQYNSTVTQPEYDVNLDFTGNYLSLVPGTGGRLGDSFGVDVDTHFLAGSMSGDPLYEFGITNPLPEQITTRYAAGGDLVLLLGEVISVTNAPIADIEITKTQGVAFKVGGTSSYTLTVTNNGDGGGPAGTATGVVTVTDTLPAGITITSLSAPGWTCSNTVQALTCEYDIAATHAGGVLAEGASLDPILVNVSIADGTTFPNLSNSVTNVARALYSGGGCTLPATGVSPDPDDCLVSPEFDNVQDLEGGALSMNDLTEKSENNNNVDALVSNVAGIQTDLSINKAVDGVLQESSNADYTFTVTNLGPDTATKLITVTDVLPAGLTYASFTDAELQWSCGNSGQTVTCTFDAAVHTLAPAASTDVNITVSVAAPAIENSTVNNTGTVAIAGGNFDTVAGNNSDTDSTVVTGEPAAAQEKFLMSVNLDATTLGGLTFDKGDIILYDPDTDIATVFFDNSAVAGDVKDIDAFHVRRNGHIIMSTRESASSLLSLSFEPGDLVVYDPLLGTAIKLLDGTAVFTSGSENIDAVFEQDNGLLVLSTLDGAQIGAFSFDRNDLIEYNPTASTVDGLAPGEARLLLDGGGAPAFNADVQLTDVYLREGADEVYVMTIGQTSATIATGGTTFTGDDIASYDATNMDSRIEFRGSVPNGVFDPLTSARFIDGVHLVEEGYFGHFSIVEVESGDTCHPTRIRISKHMGLTHTRDTAYAGTVRITAPAGTWSLYSGNGTLSLNGSEALYTYQASDLGTVTLDLTVDTPTSFDIDVTNGIVTEVEAGAEDPTFSFGDVTSMVSYADDFASGGFSGNTGTSSWAGDWVETDLYIAGAGDGHVRVSSGEAYFRNRPSAQTSFNNMPALVREVDLSLYTLTESLELSFNWRTVSANTGDAFVVQARSASGDGWTTLETFTGLSGTTSGARNYDLTAAGIVPSASTQIRFGVSSGYSVSGDFIIDNVSLSTGTTDCGVGSVHHYEISHIGIGVMCEAYSVTFVAHDVAHTAVAPGLGTAVTLSAVSLDEPLVQKGFWSQAAGYGVPANGTAGVATYTFGLNETTVVANYNLTAPAAGFDPETINFGIAQGAITESTVDPDFEMYKSGFVFVDVLGNKNQPLNLMQIAGKSSALAPSNPIFIRAVRSTDDAFPQCEALLGNQTVSIPLAAECHDPAACASQAVEIFDMAGSSWQALPTVNDNLGAGVSSALVGVNLAFDADGEAEVRFRYGDVGKIVLHAEYNIPYNNNPAGTPSGGYMVGTSEEFLVRPFGIDIDMRGNLAMGQTENDEPAVLTALDANGQIFRKAGEQFSVNVRAVAYNEAAPLDADQNGIPDAGADLSANLTTPNFGNESTAESITVSASVVEPDPANNPGLENGIFDSFVNGEQLKTNISWQEVGIINLQAALDGDGVYMDSGVALAGFYGNVGRFVPDHYTVNNLSFQRRSLSCTPESTFTYMDEGIGVMFDVEARAANGSITRNYYEGFVKLDSIAKLALLAGNDDGAGTFTLLPGARLDSSGLSLTWDATEAHFTGGTSGEGAVTGSLVLTRNGAEDGPFPLLRVGIAPDDQDDDNGAGITLRAVDFDLDLDNDTTSEHLQIADTDLRYGRLILHNAYGSEISDQAGGEDLEVIKHVEYWDGTKWVVNADDDCTPYASANLSFVPSSFQGLLLTNTNAAAVVAGGTGVVLGGASTVNPTPTSTNNPLYLTAPGVNLEGNALIEFDLSGAGLDFLGYDWRTGTPVDPYDETPDGGYGDNPRARVEFGTFRGHNRIINWQERILP